MPEGFSHYEVKRGRRPGWWIALAVLALTSAALWLVFDFGRQRAGFDSEVQLRQLALMELRVKQLSKENAELRDKLGAVERSAAVDKEAYGRIEHTLKSLQDENYALKQQLTVFQSIVAADSESDVVTIQQFKLTAGKQARSYHYRLSLMQSKAAARRVKGKVTFQIEGIRDGKEQAAPLTLLTQGRLTERDFSFRQVQTIEGEVVVPDNFRPVRARVRISVLGKAGAKPAPQAEKIFDWAEITD